MSIQNIQRFVVALVGFVLAVVGASPAHALSTAFTYQGQLELGTSPANGSCDFQFSLYDAATSGTLLGMETVTCPSTPLCPTAVSNGLFTAELNEAGEFGANPFNGSDRWLAISVRCPSGSGGYTDLTPRQLLTAAPYALYASAAGSAANLSGNLSGDVTGTQSATTVARINGSPLGSLGAATSNQALTFHSGSWGPANVVNSLTAGSGISVSPSSTGNITVSVPSGGVANSMLANPSVTVTAGTGLSGGGSVSLGGTTSLSLSSPVSVANGGTGGGTPAAARANLAAAASGTNADITSLIGLTGNIVLPGSTATAGNILKGSTPFLHNFNNNTFLGANAGNFSTTGIDNSGVGENALHANAGGNLNTAVGENALSGNTGGSNNTAVGGGALQLNTAGDNTALGANALHANTTGSNNTALGFQALQVQTGNGATAVGYNALQENTVDGNTAVGRSSLAANIGGGFNAALGDGSLASNTSGNANTAVGAGALASNTTSSGNTAVGTYALNSNNGGTDNTAVAQNALQYNTTAGGNTAIGWSALFNNTKGVTTFDARQCTGSGSPNSCCIASGMGNCAGNDNTAVGWDALFSNTAGLQNTAVGSGALAANTTGHQDTAVGANALESATNCNGDVAIGYQALVDPICGSGENGEDNVAVGRFALLNNTTGFENVAVGTSVLRANMAGHQNIAVGTGNISALENNIDGNNNTCMGVDASGNGAGQNVVHGSNNIYIATSGSADESNTIRIGTPGTQSAIYLAGIPNGNTLSPAPFAHVEINSNGQLGFGDPMVSSARFKENIQAMGDTSDLLRLRPVRFRYKRDIDPSRLEQYGLVAEEVAKVYPDLVSNDAEGRPYTVRYQFLAPMLLNEMQKQAKEIAALRKQVQELSTLKSETAVLQARLAALEAAGTERTASHRSSGTHATAAGF